MITFFLDLYDNIQNFINSVDFSRTILTLQLISYAITFFFVFLIVVLLKKSEATWWIGESAAARRSVFGPQALNKKWLLIQERLKRGDDANLKLAIIEADNIFDDILKQMGLPGVDMTERLRQFEPQELKSVNLVWEAHRLRNQIVQDPTMQISGEQAEQAVQNYETAMKELEYL
jgi:hypothetical protein